ncbi:helix-turn-helix transcriptional regulator [Acinetobacter baumannii]|uniref:helix-turn-helix transcriptional regulator n=1 Tax=Acinetobacter baumannii TaxID=470 RepID=UPI0010204B2F|nr:WYL domain-containing protein [Acinetobacter baumannii]MDC4644019.1 WYL domain-containing protein [Acinetobacter baumannii]RYL19016.1 WYL domain-containing protein [Acinetobacter baumannii]RYL31901.1 WYL domain-containing protein [Acinetobacter baumannii]RYL46579.1 WYL domain-containing protein [Acinetobacter baumannii]
MEGSLSTHERLAERLVKIIVKLNSGEKLSVHELAQEFKTHPRTIQRDFERLEITELPLVRDEVTKRVYLNPMALGNYGVQDIIHFAQISGVHKLYPKLNVSFLRGILDQHKRPTYIAKGYSYEDTSLFTEHFKQLNTAIQQRKQIQFLYKNVIRNVLPYRVIHHHGSWYLAATEQEELKTYRLSRISNISISQDHIFEHDADVLQLLDNEDSIWFGLEKTEVVLTVQADVAMHFLQRALLPEQQVIKQLEDGGLLISSQISHYQQILPLVRYWIPHVKIVNPVELQEELEGELRGYLNFS